MFFYLTERQHRETIPMKWLTFLWILLLVNAQEIAYYYNKVGVECKAGDYLDPKGTNVNAPLQCATKCSDIAGICKGFVYVQSNTGQSGKCYLLKVVCKEMPQNGASKLWLPCEVGNCKSCKNEPSVCDGCVQGAGLPNCEIQFDGYQYTPGLYCTGPDLKQILYNRSPFQCHEQCQKTKGCEIFQLVQDSCYLKSKCSKKLTASPVVFWENCGVKMCKTCKSSIQNCDACIFELKLPHCITEVDGYQVKSDFECSGPKHQLNTIKTVTECVYECQKQKWCVAFAITTGKCYTIKDCSKLIPNTRSLLWQGCQIKHCKACKKNIATCDVCMYGLKLPNCISEFDGYDYKSDFECSGPKQEASSIETVSACLKECQKRDHCEAFSITVGKCYVISACNNLNRNKRSLLWQVCHIKNCKTCKQNVATCDVCMYGLKLPNCISEFDGYQYNSDFECSGPRRETRIKSVPECAKECQNYDSCEAFSITEGKCSVIRACNNLSPSKGSLLWQSCHMKNCKVCKLNVTTCGECMYGLNLPECTMEFDGFQMRKSPDCSQVSVGRKDYTKNYDLSKTMYECYEYCKLEYDCFAFLITKRGKCQVKNSCGIIALDTISLMWQACTVRNCKICKSDITTCDMCMHGLNLPNCIVELVGYKKSKYLKCAEYDLKQNGFVIDHYSACHEKCEENDLCKAFLIAEGKCYVNNECNVISSLKPTVLWQACQTKSCEICNEDILTCDVCMYGFKGNFCKIEFDSYRFIDNFDCLGNNTEGGTSKYVAECHEKCESETNCIAFSFIEDKCYLKSTCDSLQENDKSRVWQACHIKNCKICKQITTCDECLYGLKLPNCTMEFDGFQITKSLDCSQVNTEMKDYTMNYVLNETVSECYEHCKLKYDCLAFLIIKGECQVKNSCDNFESTATSLVWQACEVKNCKICNKNVRTCDMCMYGLKLPNCTGELIGYKHSIHSKCSANDRTQDGFAIDHFSECYQKCKEDDLCVAFLIAEGKCYVDSMCNFTLSLIPTLLWQACLTKNCKICNEDIWTCDVCLYGFEGEFCKIEFDGYKFENNFDCFGKNITEGGNSIDVTECQQICDGDTKCIAFSFIEGRCYLKSTCEFLAVNEKSQVWRVCDIKNCKTCNLNITKCEVCMDGMPLPSCEISPILTTDSNRPTIVSTEGSTNVSGTINTTAVTFDGDTDQMGNPTVESGTINTTAVTFDGDTDQMGNPTGESGTINTTAVTFDGDTDQMGNPTGESGTISTTAVTFNGDTDQMGNPTGESVTQESGMSDGAKAAIGIVPVIIIAATAAGYVFYKKRRAKQNMVNENNENMEKNSLDIDLSQEQNDQLDENQVPSEQSLSNSVIQ